MSWSSGLEVYRSCPYLPRHVVFLIDYALYRVVELLYGRQELRGYEFLVYGRVRQRRGWEAFYIGDPYIPVQEVSAASVRVRDSNSAGYDVVVHKHPSGVTKFSQTDYDYINVNNTVSLLWVDGGWSAATIRVRAPCGKYLLADLDRGDFTVYVAVDPHTDLGKLEEELSALVDDAVRNRIKRNGSGVVRVAGHTGRNGNGGKNGKKKGRAGKRVDCDALLNRCIELDESGDLSAAEKCWERYSRLCGDEDVAVASIDDYLYSDLYREYYGGWSV